MVADAFKGESDNAQANFTGQLWALRGRIKPGDLMVMPMKTTKQIAFGRVAGPYQYRATEDDPTKRHVIPVDWHREDLPRSLVKQDLLFILGSALTVFSPSKNDALTRLEHLLEHGTDPGQVATPLFASTPTVAPVAQGDDVDEPEMVTDIEQAAYDQIEKKIAEEFAGHGLATLVSALLSAAGWSCRQSPPGPDGGVDIVAGRGLLGLDDPLLVQVKSGAQIGAPIVSQLHGVMSTHGATQGLLVAWGGLSKPAQDALKNQLRVRVWEAADVVDQVQASYDLLDADIRSRIPLKRVWMLSNTEG
ncbi:restriction endonuclease [Mycobacterium sp. 1274756.6]|uniref:restriction endonuclease n=1 Tax=Mycobacterium sp. 1274756.6 TaxID=1834076 RepID=UPI001E37A689|nr:restriction endonuclease [Mycobacterium sp. 1274756.6]